VVSALDGPAAPALVSELQSHGCANLRRIDFDADCDDASWESVRSSLIAQVKETARIAGPGEIYIAAGSLPADRLGGILAGLRLLPRSVQVLPDESLAFLLRFGVRSVGGALTIEVQRAPLSALQQAVKRTIDVVGAAALLLFLSPLFLAIAAAVKLDSAGPVFFLQTRNGRRGRPFRIMKFRTMTVMEDGASVIQVCRNDARVTRLGRFLRTSSLDELPQLLNVLEGSMSLVGPRPHAVAHDELYAKLIENYALRQHVKPGISGWAQVNGLRGETPTVELMYRRIELDLWYAANCSLSLDLQIIARTLGVLLSRKNAF
jgi:undecaprenyl-phosphate galactose phosphotransferase/putative colanic acid biosynthesis UDP-glucose lipid carrier transferase